MQAFYLEISAQRIRFALLYKHIDMSNDTKKTNESRTPSTSSIAFGALIIFLFIAMVNFVSVMSADEGGHGEEAHGEHATEHAASAHHGEEAHHEAATEEHHTEEHHEEASHEEAAH